MKPRLLANHLADIRSLSDTQELMKQIKHGYFLTLQQAAESLGISVPGLQNRLRIYPELTIYRCYIRGTTTTRRAIFVHPKYKAELIRKHVATDTY